MGRPNALGFISARAALLVAVCLPCLTTAHGESPITVEGRVEAVFLSTHLSEPVYAIQLLVKRGATGGDLPATGETIFVTYESARSRRTAPSLPEVGEDIRAEINAASPGRWQASGDPWFKAVRSTRGDSSRNEADDKASLLVDLRGMTCEAKIIGGQLAFEVKAVDSNGPAPDAGFQQGDIITAIDGKPVSSVAALKELATQSKPLELTVIDINTGRLAKVILTPMAKPSTPVATEEKPPKVDDSSSDEKIAASLGIKVVASRIGTRKSAVAIMEVSRLGSGANAGLEVGDAILAVNDQPVGNADDFAAALPPEGGKATLLVRDSRSGNDVPVEVTCRKIASKPSDQLPPTNHRSVPGGPVDEWGLSMELAFYQAEAAVEIMGVAPGSAAARAGIEPGWMIIAADGKPVLHPDALRRLLRDAKGTVRLTLADPRTKHEREVELRP